VPPMLFWHWRLMTLVASPLKITAPVIEERF